MFFIAFSFILEESLLFVVVTVTLKITINCLLQKVFFPSYCDLFCKDQTELNF